MRLIRALFFRSASNNSNIILQHIPGVLNTYADLLSRLQVQKFHAIHPSADPDPTTIHPDVWLL